MAENWKHLYQQMKKMVDMYQNEIVPGMRGTIERLEGKSTNPYWDNICKIADRQRNKGIETYGKGIEMNPADAVTRIEYLQEELVDALMYCEWIKASLLEKKGTDDR